MKNLPEKDYQLLFRVSIAIKALVSAAELVFGFLLLFFSYGTLYKVAIFLTGGELAEAEPDPLWRYLFQTLKGFSATPRSFWVFLFLSHAIVKIFLLWGLWREKLWAYPIAAIVFVLFIFSQLYQMTFTPSVALWFITILDVLLVILIVHEYRRKKRLAKNKV